MGALTEKPGRVKRLLHRLSADTDVLAAEELQKDCAQLGATAISDCATGTTVRVAGTLRTVTLRPRGGVPALEAELYDGSGIVELVWLGRRRIAGVEPGVQLIARGRLTMFDGKQTIFNPLYDLLPD
jgi:hypothetical protein